MTGDQFDLSRALVQATQYGKACSARLDALVDAIDVRDQIMATVKTQLEKRSLVGLVRISCDFRANW